MTNKEKLKALKRFLRENNLRFIENYHSKTFDVDMTIKIKKLRIAVFLSNDDRNYELSMVFAKSRFNGQPLFTMYNPFFIRESETEDFIIEKMQNCIISRMQLLQKKWQKKQERLQH